MYCVNCGTELPNDANFCLKCGKPQKAGVEQAEEQWEYCEIVWQGKKKGIHAVYNTINYLISYFSLDTPYTHFQFWADASGPNGTYNAGETEWFRGDVAPGKEGQPAYYWLRNKLLKDGWEQIGRGAAWWNDKFRRRVKN